MTPVSPIYVALMAMLAKSAEDRGNDMLGRVAKVRCREILAADLESIVEILAAGFPRKTRAHWVQALEILSHRVPPEGFPRYGYMLEAGTTAVGVLLLICFPVQESGELRTCGAAWYVVPDFRSWGSLLISRSLKLGVGHMNVTPAIHTWPIIEALGLKRFCEGTFAAIPALSARSERTKVMGLLDTWRCENFAPSAADLRLLRDHEHFGCLSLWCETNDGGYPFIFKRRSVKHLPLVAQLIYCTSVDDLVRLAGPIGSYLVLRGMPVMFVPANGPIPNLIGKYFDGRPMYYRGPTRPRLGDLGYTEMAMFGL